MAKSADGVVQVFPNSTGEKIDNSKLTRDDGTIVERQRVVIGDPIDTSGNGVAAVAGGQQLTADADTRQLLYQIARDLQAMRFMLSVATGLTSLQ